MKIFLLSKMSFFAAWILCMIGIEESLEGNVTHKSPMYAKHNLFQIFQRKEVLQKNKVKFELFDSSKVNISI